MSNADAPLLHPDRLRHDFGLRHGSARRAVQALLAALAKPRSEASEHLKCWKQLIDHACGRDVNRRSPATDRMATAYALEPAATCPAELLFAVHSYYGLVAGLLVRQLVKNAASCENELFDWPLFSRQPDIAALVRHMAEQFARYPGPSPHECQTIDFFGPLYQDLVPRPVRHGLGEYYTPEWLVEHVLDQVGYDGDSNCRLLDPACGSGTFLLAAIRRIRGREGTSEATARSALANVVGIDLNPVAVLSAKANCLIALGDLAGNGTAFEPTVLLRDSIVAASEEPARRFDVVVGNPPWIAWDSLPAPYREVTKPLWQRYGLFSLSACDARHGGGKKDLAMLMLYVAADRYLRDGGRLGMVITQTVFQTRGAGDGFRRFQLGEQGPPLRVLRVDDLVDAQPFPGAANWTATVVLEKGQPTDYPVPYFKWSRQTDADQEQADGSTAAYVRQSCRAQPIHDDSPGSPWLVVPEEAAMFQHVVGPSQYQAHLGANTAGANGVFWVEVLEKTANGVLVRNIPAAGKRPVRVVEQEIEADLVFPLLRWGDIQRYAARPRLGLLLTQDVARRRGIDQAIMESCYPRTLTYLKQFEPLLTSRAAYRRYQQHGPFWSMYNVGPYTLSPVKVVWRRMDRRIRASVLEPFDHPLLGCRPVVPQETCVLISVPDATEAHYLCAMLNSSPVDFLARSHTVRGGKGFGTPGMLDYLGIERFDPTNPCHGRLARASQRAHEARRQERPLEEIQAEIDRIADALRGRALPARGSLEGKAFSSASGCRTALENGIRPASISDPEALD
ncbi:MAG: N-6 DNA methylase [Rhodopirellula sp.]|nr:N-6 DNA methylase [Rhodopirellula sp.]